MKSPDAIQKVSDIIRGNRIRLPEEPGVYAFWWIADKKELMASNRHIILKGPGGKDVDVSYHDWWPDDLAYPCLYVGKSTNIKKRFSQHLMRGSSGRVHAPLETNHKQKPHTTACQLRFGIEHIFPDNDSPLDIINNKVGFSCRTDFSDNAIAERFFEEDLLVGLWRPWFNVDSER
jgi:hypothetical protein